MSAAENCIFCRSAQGQAPATVVHDDGVAMAFMDLYPASVGHTLVIPKAHAENLLEIEEADLLAVTRLTQRIAHAVQRALAPDGIRIMQFNGAAAGQTVFHYHNHVIPTWAGEPRASHGKTGVSHEALEAVAAQLRGIL